MERFILLFRLFRWGIFRVSLRRLRALTEFLELEEPNTAGEVLMSSGRKEGASHV